jgi:hypothetical protein
MQPAAAEHAPTTAAEHAPTTAAKHAPTTAAEHAPTTAAEHAPTTAAKHAPTTATKHAPTTAGAGQFKLALASVVDFQEYARQDGQLQRQPDPQARSRKTGLRRTVRANLGKDLDKREQRSDWDRRPLKPAQLSYAAADAAVLLALHATWLSLPHHSP